MSIHDKWSDSDSDSDNGDKGIELQKKLRKELRSLRKVPGNGFCAECVSQCKSQQYSSLLSASKKTMWASVSLGVFICIRCAGGHYYLGTHISRVRSTTLDNWTSDQVTKMKRMGNYQANLYWEHSKPSNIRKPREEDHSDYYRWYMNQKYSLKKWIRRTKEEPQDRIPREIRISNADGDGGTKIEWPSSESEEEVPITVAPQRPTGTNGMDMFFDLNNNKSPTVRSTTHNGEKKDSPANFFFGEEECRSNPTTTRSSRKTSEKEDNQQKRVYGQQQSGSWEKKRKDTFDKLMGMFDLMSTK